MTESAAYANTVRYVVLYVLEDLIYACVSVFCILFNSDYYVIIPVITSSHKILASCQSFGKLPKFYTTNTR